MDQKLTGSSAKPNRKGFFISFEGGEGVGKSTQIRLLAEKLASLDFYLTISREPGGTPGAEAVRHVVLDKAAAEPFGPQMEALMFAAARLDHVQQIIKPALERSDIVIIDRFMDSTRVYQGTSNDLDAEFVDTLERIAIDNTPPDLTIILDLDPVIGLSRANERRGLQREVDRFERESVDEHATRRAAFLAIAKAEPQRCRVVDAAGSVDAVSQNVWIAVRAALADAGYHIPSDDHPRAGLSKSLENASDR